MRSPLALTTSEFQASSDSCNRGDSSASAIRRHVFMHTAINESLFGFPVALFLPGEAPS
jgi:hypothetical protein